MKDTPMHNKAMERKFRDGKAIDLSDCAREGGFYIIDSYREGFDYCDAKTERWIWSIGKRLSDGVILASTGVDLYQNEAFECLWLR